MSGESGAVVGRRGRAEIERLAGLYQTSGMGRKEFCRSHGMALSTLNRYLKFYHGAVVIPLPVESRHTGCFLFLDW
jgi:hypothetical protein